MEDDEPEKTYPPSPAKMSKAPSWLMLGFLLGAGFVWGFRRGEEKTEPPVVTLTEWPKARTVPASPLTTIEGVFAAYGQNAVWSNDVTEVAMWRTDTREFSEFYEVRRVGDALYFRSIPRLTRPLIRHGAPPPRDTPLDFTESEEQYREWYEHGRFERTEEASVHPTLLGPALIPAGETIPRVQTPKPAPAKIVAPMPAGIESPKTEASPKP
jgi:hypothetical protein